jgi:hypothetical protein
MIGDRHHDIDAATEVGTKGLGVLWGSGSRNELATAGAHAIAERPAVLLRLLAGYTRLPIALRATQQSQSAGRLVAAPATRQLATPTSPSRSAPRSPVPPPHAVGSSRALCPVNGGTAAPTTGCAAAPLEGRRNA